MFEVLAFPIEVRLIGVSLLGAVLGTQINRAIYRLAWNPRSIGPWSAPHANAAPRRWYDFVPVLGWFFLRRESPIHGVGYWVRPLLIELLVTLGFALLYWWEIGQQALLPRLPGLVPPTTGVLHCQLLSHLILISLMLVATFIDFDEKTIPDAITVPGTLLGLILAAVLPWSQLPVAAGPPPPAVKPLWLTSTQDWPAWLDGRSGLAVGLLVFVSWLLAILPKICTLRRGWIKAVIFLVASMLRYTIWPIMLPLGVAGCAGIVATWSYGGEHWRGLLTALAGLAFGGGLIWAVRIVGSRTLGREAMGFGDVTLMAMIGTYVGWQPSLLIFFLAPLAALLISVTQWVLTRRHEIAFGPYLCLATLAVIVGWSQVWEQVELNFVVLGWLIPVMTCGCLVLMAGMLLVIRLLRGGNGGGS